MSTLDRSWPRHNKLPASEKGDRPLEKFIYAELEKIPVLKEFVDKLSEIFNLVKNISLHPKEILTPEQQSQLMEDMGTKIEEMEDSSGVGQWFKKITQTALASIHNTIKNKPPRGIEEEPIVYRESTKGSDHLNLSEVDFEGKAREFKRYAQDFEEASKKYGVPIGVMVNLAVKEGSHGSPKARPSNGSAFGIGQMIDDTWKRFADQDAQRDNPHDQIMAMAKYLKYLHEHKKNRNKSWGEAVVLYHTGEGGVTRKNLENYKKNNPAIAKLMEKDKLNNPDAYMQAAKEYYDVHYTA